VCVSVCVCACVCVCVCVCECVCEFACLPNALKPAAPTQQMTLSLIFDPALLFLDLTLFNHNTPLSIVTPEICRH